MLKPSDTMLKSKLFGQELFGRITRKRRLKILIYDGDFKTWSLKTKGTQKAP